VNSENKATWTPELVLVVDDVEGNRILARAYLERIGWQVEEAAGGLEAIEFLKRKIPQAMLIDILMPDVSGDQLASFVRSRRELSNVRLIGYTADCVADDVKRFMAAGFDEVLIKPVLMAAMSKALPNPRQAQTDAPTRLAA
jgi:CheY-like chemotaxis protein